MKLRHVLTAIFASVAVIASVTAHVGTAWAAPGSPGQRTGTIQYSADGATWSDDAGVIPEWSGGPLVPGGLPASRTYFVRNASTESGTLIVSVGSAFTVSSYGVFTVRSDVGGATGKTFVYYGDKITDRTFGPPVSVGTQLATADLARQQQIKISDYIGLPENVGNESQGATLDDGIVWSLVLPSQPPDNGSSGSSGSSSGSLGSTWGSSGLRIF